MLVNGDIGRPAYRTAVHDTSLHLKPGHLYETIREPYFFSYVRDELIAEYGANTVRSGGLRVYTTIDRRFQRAALASIRKTLYERTDPAAAVVAIDPRNGAIRAMTSLTPSGQHTQFNLVAQARRQAGSTFKTIVLAAAVAQGMDPNTTLYRSTPFTYRPDPSGSCQTNWWCVTTYDNRYLGTTSVETATVHSDNTVFAQLTLDVGPENVAAMAKKLGVETPLTTPDGGYVPSLGLGAIAVSPLDMASAYATLAAGGVRSKPMAIRRVVLAGGKVDTDAGWGKPQRTRVLSDGVASTVTHVLEQNMLYGTGVGAYFGRPSAGKTGTTDNYADAWFCGYTPNLEATIWVGYPRAEIPMLHVHGSVVSGPGFPATIWRLFMESAIGSSKALDFPDPTQEPHFTPWQKQYSVTYVSPPAPASPPTPAPTTTPPATTVEPTTNGPATGGPPADPN